mmetsp:Transcript_20754/g.45126  ORF Transcript_20754/g.45126 Transcript_20754/m.45126 type:complete len:203 (+) Transcript_20754:1907-2515(+)
MTTVRVVRGSRQVGHVRPCPTRRQSERHGRQKRWPPLHAVAGWWSTPWQMRQMNLSDTGEVKSSASSPHFCTSVSAEFADVATTGGSSGSAGMPAISPSKSTCMLGGHAVIRIHGSALSPWLWCNNGETIDWIAESICESLDRTGSANVGASRRRNEEGKLGTSSEDGVENDGNAEEGEEGRAFCACGLGIEGGVAMSDDHQ